MRASSQASAMTHQARRSSASKSTDWPPCTADIRGCCMEFCPTSYAPVPSPRAPALDRDTATAEHMARSGTYVRARMELPRHVPEPTVTTTRAAPRVVVCNVYRSGKRRDHPLLTVGEAWGTCSTTLAEHAAKPAATRAYGRSTSPPPPASHTPPSAASRPGPGCPGTLRPSSTRTRVSAAFALLRCGVRRWTCGTAAAPARPPGRAARGRHPRSRI